MAEEEGGEGEYMAIPEGARGLVDALTGGQASQIMGDGDNNDDAALVAATDAAAVAYPQAQDADDADLQADLEQEALRRQLEEEAAAVVAAVNKKKQRSAPPRGDTESSGGSKSKKAPPARKHAKAASGDDE